MNLTRQEIGTVIIRVIGIYTLIHALELATTLVQMLIARTGPGYQTDTFNVLLGLCAILPLAIIGVWFLISSKALGSRLVGSEQNARPTASRSAQEWEETALSLIGFYLLFSSIPRLVRIVGFMASDVLKGVSFTIEVFSFLALVAVSIWLILRAKVIVAVIHRIRAVT